MISDTAAKQLKKLYRTIIGNSISTAGARERGERLVALIDLASRAQPSKTNESADRIDELC
jgi:hypothetical protein